MSSPDIEHGPAAITMPSPDLKTSSVTPAGFDTKSDYIDETTYVPSTLPADVASNEAQYADPLRPPIDSGESS